ncbi:hypothetical protein L1276_002635 [Flavobacterium sp. HSC-32F16]|uniref:hypothetical protein n=1 Tax=Flavobacterium sp. HSC-32F16 TaxID=2910964 RepID=UPI0020A60870|nr:hypothetical protein [Flavobacterium sp. HSC-32F16]MCP2027478.1 hypothetical protein [Flavobacterium sp. HSC-32F16]
MATDRTQIGYKFENGDIPSQGDFQEVFNSFIHKDEDKADFQMVEEGRDNLHYVTPALLYTGLKNIGIITGNSYMPRKEHFDSFVGDTITLQYAPVNYSVKVFKNGQLLLEKEGQGNDGDYIINYEMAKITFSGSIDNRNIEVDYWYKNLAPNSNPGSGSSEPIDFTSFLHTSGNETKNGILTFNNTTPASTSGIVLTNSGADAGAKVLDVTVSGAGSGIAVQNTAAGTGIKVSNTGTGTGLQVNSSSAATGDPLQISKDNVVKAKIDAEGIVTAKKFVSEGGTAEKFVKGDGSLDDKIYAEDTKVIHTTGNETKDGALKLTHNTSADDVLTIEKNNSANCLKLVQNSSSSATTSTFDTNTENVNRKAISVQKIQVEKAFITHDGNVSGTSFTTLNEKADITDGFLTLAASTSATATAGHAKLYAKTDGTTDLYVMGSDGVEKKIGASGGDLDNVLHKTGYATETKNGELVIDSGTEDVSGLVLKKTIPTFDPYSGGVVYSSGYNNPYNMVELSTQEVLVANNGGNNVLKVPLNGGAPSLYSSGISSPCGIALLPSGEVLVGSIGTNSVYKIPANGGTPEIYSTGITGINAIAILPNGEALVATANASGVYKIPTGGGNPVIYSTPSSIVRDIVVLPNGDALVACQSATVYKIPFGGGPGIVYATVPNNSISLCLLPTGEVLVGAPYSSQVHKIPVDGGESSFYASMPNFYSYMALKSDGKVLISSINNDDIRILNGLSQRVLKTDTSGLVVKTKYLEDVPYLKVSEFILTSYAKLASPIFTGTPTLPTGTIATTQTTGDNSTKIATTAFVNNSLIGTLKITGGINAASHQYKISDSVGNSAPLRLSSNWVTNFGSGDIGTNTVFGIANQNNTTGFKNSSFGCSTATFNTTGGENVCIGYNAGSYVNTVLTNPNSITNQSIFIGANTTSFSNNQTNQIVIGCNTMGAGSNTVTLGNSAITSTILRGEVSATSYKVNNINTPPATATSAGTTGEIRFTATGIFICINTNTWIKCVGTTF